MSNKNKDWRLLDLKVYDNYLDEKPFVLSLLSFYAEDFKKSEKIVFYRKIDHTRSYFGWKIIHMNALEETDNQNIKEQFRV